MPVTAVSIALTLLVLSIGVWARLCFSQAGRTLRTTGRNLLTEPAPELMNERLLFLAVFAIAIWVLMPSYIMGRSNQLARDLSAENHALWPVLRNCISNGLVLLIVGSATWLTVHKPDHNAIWTTTNALRRALRIRKNAKNGVVGFVFAVLPVALVLLATQAVRSQDTQHSLLKLLNDQLDSETVALVVLSAVILAPLVEELIFRVILQGWLQSFLRPTVAIGIVALGFSAVHGWRDMMPLIPLAIVLGVLFYVTRSYLAVVVTHGLFNATNVLLAVLSAAESADSA